MSCGSFVLVLHSHLPYYRGHGMWPFGEENLYECMAETYIPLLDALHTLREEGIQANVTLGLTPILLEQLADPDLQEGFVAFLEARLQAAEEDLERYPDHDVPHSEHLEYLAQWYVDYYQRLLHRFEHHYHRDLVAGFKALQDAGFIEIITSGATHGFLPLLGQDESIHTQLKTGVETYRHHFGSAPKGVWLPECAYRPETENEVGKVRVSIDTFLHANGLQYFFTETHAIESSRPSGKRRLAGIYEPLEYDPPETHAQEPLSTYHAYSLKNTPVAVMGRNERASFQVWSAADGYPGDGIYREFHKKDETSGLHYWRITSKDAGLGGKMLYDPIQAFEKTEPHAQHFAHLVKQLLTDYKATHNEEGLVMVSFDTELFGHWWFEGVTWLTHVIRELHQQGEVQSQTASAYLSDHVPEKSIALPESSWGAGGHFHVWNNDETAWMWPQIHQAESAFKGLATIYAQETDPWKERVLNQALRELLLLQGSDWPFLVTTGQAKTYAIDRFKDHGARFWSLIHMLEKEQASSEEELELYESLDNPFAFVDFRWYAVDEVVPTLPVPAQQPLS